MRLRSRTIEHFIGFLAAASGRLLRRTIDWRARYFDPTIDPLHPHHRGRYVYLCWHEYMLMPIMLRGSSRLVALASQHRDGEIVSKALNHFGWNVVRGSTSRGGTAALRSLLRIRDRHISLTPDGPRGPRRQMSSGPIYLASKLGLPIVCAGYGYHRPWRTRSWDHFAVPRPFSRARALYGPPVRIPANLNRQEIERYRVWFEKLMNWLTCEAEEWATDGSPRPDEARLEPHYYTFNTSASARTSTPRLPEYLTSEWEDLQPVGSFMMA